MLRASSTTRTPNAANVPFIACFPFCIPICDHAQQAANTVELFSDGRRVGKRSNPIYVNLDLSAYLTTFDAAKTYLPVMGAFLLAPRS